MGLSPQFALRGGADKQGAISSSKMPQKRTETGSSKALGVSRKPC